MRFDISIVIGTLNRPDTIKLLLTDLLKISPKHRLEVLVYDQSENKSFAKLAKIFPKKQGFNHIRLQPPNTCKYLNMGWKAAQSEIVLYLDDDVTITDTTLTAHLKNYTDKNILGVAGRVINAGEKISQENEVGTIRWFGAIIKSNFSALRRSKVQFPYGCNMSFRRKTLEKLGGFDERLRGPIFSYNEVDLGYRLTRLSNSSLVFDPKALVYHKLFPTGGTRTYTKESLIDGNNFNYGFFLGKNFSLLQNILCLIRRTPYQMVHEPKAISAIIKGIVYGKRAKQK